MSATNDGSVRRVLEYFTDRKRLIAADLDRFLAESSRDLDAVGKLGRGACEVLADFATAGKMIRGGLVWWAASLGPRNEGAVARVGTAIELLQSALLIHDDIMDRDTHRRGQAAVHHRYARWAEGSGLHDSAHVGEALGICAGDLAVFLAFRAIAELDIEPSVIRRLTSLFARELSLVGVAQMMDVSAGASTAAPSSDEVLKLYLYKTGRYTFSLPLLAGAYLSGLEEPDLGVLDRIGQTLGVLFQIKDDEIGLYGDPGDTGKPVGSDIREGKKTLYHAYLLLRSPPDDLDRVRAAWGKTEIDDHEVRYLLDAIERCGARAEVAALARTLAARVEAMTGPWPFLADLLAYSLGRAR